MSRLRAAVIVTWVVACAAVVAVAWWSQDPPPKIGTETTGPLIERLNSGASGPREADNYSTMWIVLAVLTIVAIGVLAVTFVWRGGERNGGEVSSRR